MKATGNPEAFLVVPGFMTDQSAGGTATQRMFAEWRRGEGTMGEGP